MPPARIRALPILVLLLIIAAACAPTGDPVGDDQADGEPAGDGERTTLRLATWTGEEEADELQELVLDPLNESQDEFEIVHEPAPADYYTRVQTSFAGGSAADLLWLSQEHIADYADRGALLELSDRLEGSDEPAAQTDLYFDDVFITAQHDGGIYGLPWIASPVVLYYNPELFDAAGVEHPDETWDWETFRETAVELTVDDDGDGSPEQYGFTLEGWPPIHMFIWQAGGEVISEDRTESPVDTQEAIEGAEFYRSMIYNEECCPSQETIAERGFQDMFNNGTVAMFMGGAADTFDGIEEVGATLVPSGPVDRTTFAWSASTVVNAATPDPDLAVRALIELTDGIHQWKLLPPREDVIDRDALLEMVPDQWREQKEPQVDTMMAALNDARAFRVIPRHQEWDETFWNEFQSPLFEGGDAAELAEEVRPRLENLQQ
jgi:multiple sugar transport system substrate-binding protein